MPADVRRDSNCPEGMSVAETGASAAASAAAAAWAMLRVVTGVVRWQFTPPAAA